MLPAFFGAGNTNIGENWLIGIFFGIEATKNATLWKHSMYSPKPPVTDKPAQTGDMTAMAVSMATLALVGIAVIVSKKRNYN